MTGVHFLDETPKDWQNPDVLFINKKNINKDSVSVPLDKAEGDGEKLPEKMEGHQRNGSTVDKLGDGVVSKVNEAWMKQPLANQRYAKMFKPQMTVIRCCVDRLFYYPGQNVKV